MTRGIDAYRMMGSGSNPEADEAALGDMLRLAGAEDIVRNAAGGLDTVVGKRGALLSGGQHSVCALPAPCYADRISSCLMKQPAPSMLRVSKQFLSDCCGLRRLRQSS